MAQNKLYVGGLSYGTTEDGLRTHFARFGEIKEVLIIMDRETGRSKGFGFITFDQQNDAQNALELNGVELDGRTLKVNVAKEKRAGGGGGDRGGRAW
jgi:cold-inducible RNA-binding protein